MFTSRARRDGGACVTPEFKAEIVELCRRRDRSVGQVAKDFDLAETAVRDWVKLAEADAGERDGLTSGEREGLAAPRRESRGCLTPGTPAMALWAVMGRVWQWGRAAWPS